MVYYLVSEVGSFGLTMLTMEAWNDNVLFDYIGVNIVKLLLYDYSLWERAIAVVTEQVYYQ